VGERRRDEEQRCPGCARVVEVLKIKKDAWFALCRDCGIFRALTAEEKQLLPLGWGDRRRRQP